MAVSGDKGRLKDSQYATVVIAVFSVIGAVAIAGAFLVPDYIAAARAAQDAGMSAGRAAAYAKEYEAATFVAQSYEHAGDGLFAAAAYAMAAKAAERAAASWADAGHLTGTLAQSAESAEYGAAAVEAASGWMDASARAWDRAAEAAVQAGHPQRASSLRPMRTMRAPGRPALHPMPHSTRRSNV